MSKAIKYLAAIGLLFDFVGAIILAVPLLNFNRYFHSEKDRIIDKGVRGEEFIFTTERDIKNSKIALLGVSFMIIGFALQLAAERYRI